MRERGADDGPDQGDPDTVDAVGQDGNGKGKGERGGAGDGDDEQDARVGEVEGIAHVRCQDVERALRGLVEQLDREQDPEGEQRGARAQRGESPHDTRAGSMRAQQAWGIARRGRCRAPARAGSEQAVDGPVAKVVAQAGQTTREQR